MAHRGKRSIRAIVRRWVVTTSFQDRTRAEQVCTKTSPEIVAYAQVMFPNEAIPMFLADFEKGEVLTDSYGRGTLQK